MVKMYVCSEITRTLVEKSDGAVAGLLMGFDGIAVESYAKTLRSSTSDRRHGFRSSLPRSKAPTSSTVVVSKESSIRARAPDPADSRPVEGLLRRTGAAAFCGNTGRSLSASSRLRNSNRRNRVFSIPIAFYVLNIAWVISVCGFRKLSFYDIFLCMRKYLIEVYLP